MTPKDLDFFIRDYGSVCREQGRAEHSAEDAHRCARMWPQMRTHWMKLAESYAADALRYRKQAAALLARIVAQS